MKTLLTENCKTVALVVLFIGLAAMSSANASPLPDDESLVCTNALLHGTYQWSVAGSSGTRLRTLEISGTSRLSWRLLTPSSTGTGQ
jgi:hypothetical protein